MLHNASLLASRRIYNSRLIKAFYSQIKSNIQGMDEVLLSKKNGVGTIMLNRPSHLNALNSNMNWQIRQQLVTWDHEQNVCNIICSAPNSGRTQAFCAGGDVKWIAQLVKAGKLSQAKEFFYQMHKTVQCISQVNVPLVVLMDGVVMGGGAGLTYFAPFRVATERTVFAMPETAIGFMPDVGATSVFQKCPPGVDRYLTLTGARLNSLQLRSLGLCSHIIPSALLPRLREQLHNLHVHGARDHSTRSEPHIARAAVQHVLDQLEEEGNMAGVGEVARARAKLQRMGQVFVECSSVREIIDKVGVGAGGEVKKELEQAAQALNRFSPHGLRVTFERCLRAAAAAPELLSRDKQRQIRAISAALCLDYQASCNLIQHPDFSEGVRAVLVDKDHRGQWQHRSVDEVQQGYIDQALQPDPTIPPISFPLARAAL